jgi:hypothetical protein
VCSPAHRPEGKTVHTDRFDHLTKTLSAGPRRQLLRLGAALPLAGLLAALLGEEREAGAERPIDRVQRRTPQRRRARGNNDANNNGSNNNGNNNNSKAGVGEPNPTCTCCPGTQVYFPQANVCCFPGQVPFAGGCCPRDNICNNNQGQSVCCQHRCLVGVCCPCDMVASCQQCVVHEGQNPPQASCETYCAAGQVCTQGGCVTQGT